jgi:hypothetical protein
VMMQMQWFQPRVVAPGAGTGALGQSFAERYLAVPAQASGSQCYQSL